MTSKHDEQKLLAIAIAAVISSMEDGEAITPSPHRGKGDSWSKDHRRVLIGRRNLFRARSRRSTTR